MGAATLTALIAARTIGRTREGTLFTCAVTVVTPALVGTSSFHMNTATWWRACVCLLAATAIACGATGVPASAGHKTIAVGKDQAGQAIHASVGDTVTVNLEEQFGPVPGVALVWDVSTSAPSVLKLDKVTRDPAERPRAGKVKYIADFIATRTGEAMLVVRGSQTCEAMVPPACQGQEFTITVVVA